MDLPSDSNEIIKKASKSFYFASLLLPKYLFIACAGPRKARDTLNSVVIYCIHLRPDVVDLYAFMRYCDDCIDDGDLALNQKKNFLTQMAPQSQLSTNGFPLNRRIINNFAQLSKKFSFPDRIVELFVEGTFSHSFTSYNYSNTQYNCSGLYWDLENRTYL